MSIIHVSSRISRMYFCINVYLVLVSFKDIKNAEWIEIAEKNKIVEFMVNFILDVLSTSRLITRFK